MSIDIIFMIKYNNIINIDLFEIFMKDFIMNFL